MADQQFSMTDLMDLLVQKVGLPNRDRTDDPDVKFADVGLDSLAFLQLDTELASRYGVELPDRPATITFREITDAVNEHLRENAA